MPEEIGELGDDRGGLLDGKRGLLSHPQAFDAAVDAQIIIGGVGIVVAVALVGFVVSVHQDPTSRFLAVEQHFVAGIETAVVGTCHADGHLRQVVAAHIRVTLRQIPRGIAEKPNLARIQALHINTHGFEGGIIQLMDAFLGH